MTTKVYVIFLITHELWTNHYIAISLWLIGGGGIEPPDFPDVYQALYH